MYESPIVAENIKKTAKAKGVQLKEMLFCLGLNKNTLSNMYNGSMLKGDSLARIADYLDCSVDYLLGRTDVPEVNRRDDMVQVYMAARTMDGEYLQGGIRNISKDMLEKLRSASETDEDF